MTGYFCSSPLYQYRYKGRTWLFEYKPMLGPWPVRQGGDPYKRAGAVFYAMFEAWRGEPDREQYRVGGGCQPI